MFWSCFIQEPRDNTAGKEIGCYKRKSADKSNSLKKPLALTTCAEAEVI